MITLMSARLAFQQMITALGAMTRERHVEPGDREQAGFLQPKWSKLHHGGVLLTLNEADTIADLYGATHQERRNLCDLVNDCQTAHTQNRAVLHRGTSRLLGKLRKARDLPLTAVGATAIPEALQTAQYMIAVNGMTSSSPSCTALAHAEAETNHELLRSAQASRVFIVSEAAVQTTVGDHEIMADAVRQMIGLASASVVIRLVPSSAVQQPLAAPANFELHPDKVFVPTATGFLLLNGPNDLAVYAAITRQLLKCALSPQTSLRFLSAIADSYTQAAEVATSRPQECHEQQ